jgi:hypothetical protein
MRDGPMNALFGCVTQLYDAEIGFDHRAFAAWAFLQRNPVTPMPRAKFRRLLSITKAEKAGRWGWLGVCPVCHERVFWVFDTADGSEIEAWAQTSGVAVAT